MRVGYKIKVQRKVRRFEIMSHSLTYAKINVDMYSEGYYQFGKELGASEAEKLRHLLS